MMSLTGTNVLAVAWKQYRFKTKIHAIKFIILLAAQLLALLFSFSGVVTSGFYSETITYTIRCISGDIIIVFTLIWAFVIGYNMSNSLKQDFTFVSNRLSSHLSSIAFLLASAILAGVTATLCGILLRVNSVVAYLQHLLLGLFQLFNCSRLRRQSTLFQFFGYSLGQILRNEAFDQITLVIHDPVDAEVQIGTIKLKKLTQKLLELG
jgi:hypothetical protein